MRFKKFSAFVLAGTAAVLGTALLSAAPASAMTPVSELKDVSPDHWAYNAIQTLVEKYHVMEGFPDRTFRGSKTLTRYEMAAALAKVMAKVEERIAIATGQPINVEPGVNPDDLRTIARLQREFREELDALKSRVDTMDSRLMSLEKRVRISGNNEASYRDFTGANVALANQPSADFRFRNAMMWDAQLMDDLAWNGQINVDVYAPQSMANSFLRGPSTAPITDIYAPSSILTYNPGWINLASGFGSMRNHLQLGSSLMDPFKTNQWREATGSYGFVGTPGWNPGGTSLATMPMASGAMGAPVWLPGTNVIEDVLDPNGSQAYGPNGNLLGAGQVNLGPLKVGLGFNRGAITGRVIQSGNPMLPASIPALQTWNMGSMAIGTLGLDLGFARLNAAVESPAATEFSSAPVRDKMLGASLDIGSEALSLTAEVIGQHSWNVSDYKATKGSARLGAMNILDSGFGLGLGLVAGSLPTATGGMTTNSLFAGQADYHSWGVMLKTPALFIIPSLTLAAQNTGSGLTVAGLQGNTLASGLSLGTSFQLFGLPTLNAEYSLGKFNPGMNNAWWGSAPWSHEQLTINSNIKF